MSDPTESDQPPAKRRQSGRSPAYPAISLPTAIERARTLYRQEKQFATPVDSLVKHWGYSTLNGPAGLALAALKKYGLVDDEGTKDERRVKVSDLAVRILEHPKAESRDEAVREAALKPVIHREMWAEYGEDLPSDSNLIWTLSRERGFTESGAREFVKEYRETLDFASLGSNEPSSDNYSEEDLTATRVPSGLGALDEMEPMGQARITFSDKRRSISAVQTYTVPVGVGENVIVQGEFPITEAKWAQFIAVLSAMKPALVALEPSGDDPSEGKDD